MSEQENNQIVEYTELLKRVGEWCQARSAKGDVSVEKLAQKFADNVARAYGPKKH